ncbi:MAG: SIS domain-containing protein [Verrucomicrobiales bacterium]
MDSPTILQMARKVLATERLELQRLEERLGEPFVKAISILFETLQRGSKIVVLGVGKSGHIGDKLAATLTSTGSRAVVLNSLNALHGDLGLLSDGDTVIALSYSGETDEILNLLPALQRFEHQLIGITGSDHSTLAKQSHVVLNVAVEREACPLGLAPTSSTTAMLALGDALAMVLMQLRGFQEADFARYHPGGRLGRRLLLKVQDIMRPKDATATVSPESTIADALAAMSEKRTGAVIVCDSNENVLGVFTQGDFTRRYLTDPELGSRIIQEVMTPSPITVFEDRSAGEVLKILAEHRIDDIVVTDKAGRLAGMIDSQDLARQHLL